MIIKTFIEILIMFIKFNLIKKPGVSGIERNTKIKIVEDVSYQEFFEKKKYFIKINKKRMYIK